MRILVCGSRTFNDATIIWDMLAGICDSHMVGYGSVHLDPPVIIEGGAKGADKIAQRFVMSPSPFAGYIDMDGEEHSYSLEEYPADWNTHGKAAGPIRNRQMLEEGKPDMVLAFVDKPLAESRGTANMVRIAKEAGVRTYVIKA